MAVCPAALTRKGGSEADRAVTEAGGGVVILCEGAAEEEDGHPEEQGGARAIVVRDGGGSARAWGWVGGSVATTQWWVRATMATALGGRVRVNWYGAVVLSSDVCVCHFYRGCVVAEVV